MTEITPSVYETFKHRAVTDIIETMLKHREPDAFPKLANQRVAESFQNGTLAGFAPTSVVEVADTTAFSLGNWFQNAVGETPIGGSMRHIAQSAVSHDIRSSVRERRDVVRRAIDVTDAIETLYAQFEAGETEHQTADVMSLVHEVNTYANTDSSIDTDGFGYDEFGPQHFLGVEPVPAFDSIGLENESTLTVSPVLRVLEDWIADEYPSIYDDLPSNAESVDQVTS
ncbi:hypothetical protein [Salinibaculum rarum]|uniref:hypothetical protein n=1 Tax=Salinibaculum rarum TaxID=3058903 RepID=UPI00265FD00D|nr:hypothetical protein [Salinibaculum sp. KK48]